EARRVDREVHPVRPPRSDRAYWEFRRLAELARETEPRPLDPDGYPDGGLRAPLLRLPRQADGRLCGQGRVPLDRQDRRGALALPPKAGSGAPAERRAPEGHPNRKGRPRPRPVRSAPRVSRA